MGLSETWGISPWIELRVLHTTHNITVQCHEVFKNICNAANTYDKYSTCLHTVLCSLAMLKRFFTFSLLMGIMSDDRASNCIYNVIVASVPYCRSESTFNMAHVFVFAYFGMLVRKCLCKWSCRIHFSALFSLRNCVKSHFQFIS